jgi:rhodanese-related sulfurtransferase
MPTIVDRSVVRVLIKTNAQVIDVLPAKEYNASHLPGATNIPLPELSRASSSGLRSQRPTVVYCYDYQ